MFAFVPFNKLSPLPPNIVLPRNVRVLRVEWRVDINGIRVRETVDLSEVDHCICAKPVDAPIEPKRQHVFEVRYHVCVGEVPIGLKRGEDTEIPLAEFAVWFNDPGPR